MDITDSEWLIALAWIVAASTATYMGAKRGRTSRIWVLLWFAVPIASLVAIPYFLTVERSTTSSA